MKQGVAWLGSGPGLSSTVLRCNKKHWGSLFRAPEQWSLKPALQSGYSSAGVLGGGKWSREASL